MIAVAQFDVSNLREDPNDEDSYVCDISISGSIASDLCDFIPGSDGIVDEIRFFHNDGDVAFGAYEVSGEKTVSDRRERPFPFEGRFDFTAKSVPVNEGTNTFRIVSRDKVYRLDGHSLWAASFAFPYDEDYESGDSEGGVKDPMVVEAPRFIGGGSGGETSLYCFALKAARSARLVLAYHSPFPHLGSSCGRSRVGLVTRKSFGAWP